MSQVYIYTHTPIHTQIPIYIKQHISFIVNTLLFGLCRTIYRDSYLKSCVLVQEFLSSIVCGHQKRQQRGFPGGPVVKNPPSNAGDAGLFPGRGTKIPHAVGQLSLRAPEPKRHTQRAHVPQVLSLHATTRDKPERSNKRSHMPQLRPDTAK